MALPTVFTPGDVFTAANANLLRSNQYNKTTSTKTVSYVLVAADVGTRVLMNAAGSTTITANTSLFAAGDTLEISNIGAGVCTITSGTCTVTSSTSLALAQYQSGTLFFTSASAAIFIASAVTATAAALVLVKSQAIGTTVSSVVVTGAFSATYEAYKIVISGTSSSSTSDFITLKLGSTTTGYYSAGIGVYYNSADGSSYLKQNNNTANFTNAGTLTNNVVFLNLELVNPQLAELTQFSTMLSYYNSALNSFGYLDNSTQYTDFTLTPTSGNITGGTIYVYGYSKA